MQIIPLICIKKPKNFFFSAKPAPKKYSIAKAIQYFFELFWRKTIKFFMDFFININGIINEC